METKPQRSRSRDEDGKEKTSMFDNKLDFFMVAISSTVGLGNVWRFPYIAYRNGGGAFLIPFVLMLIVIGFPLVTMDLALGQYGRRGPFGVWNLCPIFQGVGWSMCIVSFLFNTYFVMFMAYSMYYIAASFSAELPWASCIHEWNTGDCMDESRACDNAGGNWDWMNSTCIPVLNPDNVFNSWDQAPGRTPSDEYFHRVVLGLSNGIDDIGGIEWRLAVCLLLAWTLIVLALSMGPKSWGKVSYVTALLPYVVMLALLIQACLKTGAGQGIRYFITPDFSRLADMQVWTDAATQVFFTFGCGMGCFITIGKHSQSRNNPIIAAGVLVFVEILTCLLCGFVIFAVLGQMAARMNVSISEVASSGPSLAFILYPAAVNALPLPQLWCVLFFLMLIMLGLGTVIPLVANILGALTEEIELLSTKRNRLIALICLAAVSFLIGLIYTTNGGMYVLTLMDYFVPTLSLLILGLLEVIVVAWMYGSGSMLRDVSSMTGWRQNYLHFFTVFWRAVTPIVILALTVMTCIFWYPLQFGDYMFPMSTNVVGWLVTFCELLPIPVVIIYKLCMATDRQDMRNLIRPTADWGAETRQSETPDTIYPTTETLIDSKV